MSKTIVYPDIACKKCINITTKYMDKKRIPYPDSNPGRSSWSARVSFLVVRGIWWASPNFTIVFEASSSTDGFLVAVSFAFRHDFTGIRSCDCLVFLDGTPSVRAICFPLDDFLYLLYSHHAFTGHLLRVAAPYRSPFEVLSCLIQGIFNIFGVSELVFSTVTAFYRLPWPWWVFVLFLGFLGDVSALAGASSSSVCHLCTRWKNRKFYRVWNDNEIMRFKTHTLNTNYDLENLTLVLYIHITLGCPWDIPWTANLYVRSTSYKVHKPRSK